jgi:hypothetical protein
MEKLLLTRVTPRRECTSLSEAPEPSHAERIRTHISALKGTKESPDRVYTQIVGHGLFVQRSRRLCGVRKQKHGRLEDDLPGHFEGELSKK